MPRGCHPRYKPLLTPPIQGKGLEATLGGLGGKRGILPKAHQFTRANNTAKDIRGDAGGPESNLTQEPLGVKAPPQAHS